MSSAMSDSLKRTLGIVESGKTNVPAEIPVYNDDGSEYVPPKREMVPFVPKDVSTTIPETDNSDLRDDYITSRNITHTLIDYAGGALQGALQVAIESQHPKAFEVFNQLALTMRGLSKDLIDMQKTYQSIVEANKIKVEQTITQNNVTINTEGSGTTNTSLSEVVKMIKKMTDKSTPMKDVDDVIDMEE